MNKDPGHKTFGQSGGLPRTDPNGSKARSVIVFGLICDEGHEFEGWFRSAVDFDRQHSARAVACPACHSTHVEKGLLTANRPQSQTPGPYERPYGDASDLTDNAGTIAQLEAEIAGMRRQIKEELRDYIETTGDLAATDFPEYETFEDMVSLIDEGTPVAPRTQPPSPRRKKLN